MAEADEQTSFDAKLKALVAARKQGPGRFLGEVAKGMLRGAAGLQYQPPQEGAQDAARMEMLSNQAAALAELEGAAGGDPSKMAKAKLDFLAKLVGEARQRLNKKAEVYSKAQYNKVRLLLDNFDDNVDNQRALITTLEPARRGGSGGAGAPADVGKVDRTFYAIASKLAPGKGGEVGVMEALASTTANARLNPAERQLLMERLEESERYPQTTSTLPGARPTTSSAYSQLQSLGDSMGGAGGVEAVTAALEQQFSQDAQYAQAAASSGDHEGYLDNLPGELRQRIKDMHFELDEHGEPFLDPVTKRPILKDSAEMASRQRLTAQGLEEGYQNMASTINQLVTGAGGGDFAGEMKDILGGYGAGTVEELFARYGLDTASMQEREDAVRGKYSDQREKVQSELERLAAAPKAPVARAGYEVMTDAGFSPAMKERGYTDNVAGLRALAREAGREMKADRKETRGAARARLAKPRVEAALREKLYGRRGPEQVEG